jgi:hypothetical protein
VATLNNECRFSFYSIVGGQAVMGMISLLLASWSGEAQDVHN